MQIVLNPLTGELDYVGTSGGGGGGVTSVFGGVGITNTPDPIVGVGTVDLDIFSLTTGGAFASGDWLPFVDVSVGTTPASQRKLTIADLVSGINPLLDHGTLLGLGDDDHPQYLLLAGRAGGQVANGGTAASEVLQLLGTANATRGPVRVNDATYTHASGTFGSLQIGGTVTNNGGAQFNFLEIGQIAGSPRTFSITTTPVGRAVIFQPSIRNTTVGVAVDLGAWILFANAAQYRTNNTVGTTISEIRTFADGPTLNQITGGDITCAIMTTVDCRPTISAGATVTTRRGVRFLNRSGAGTQTDVIGFDYEAQTTAGLNIAFRNQDTLASVRSAGPVRIGDTNAPVETLDVVGNIKLVPSPGASQLKFQEPGGGADVTTFEAQAQAADIHYVLPAAQGGAGTALRNDGAGILSWVAFQPLDAGLTALASLGAGIAVSDGADGWTPRSIAVTDTATIDFTVTNANGVAGNPTITGSVIVAGLNPLLDHGTLLGLGDDDHAQYLLLAGRAGTTNNPILSTTIDGTLTGSTTASKNLLLASNNSGTPGTVNIVDKTLLWTSLTAFANGVNRALDWQVSATITGNATNVCALNFNGTMTTSAPGPITGDIVWIRNAVQENITLAGTPQFMGGAIIANQPKFTCSGVGVNPLGGCGGMDHAPTYQTSAGATIPFGSDGAFSYSPTFTGAISGFTVRGFRVKTPGGTTGGAAISVFHGIEIEDFATDGTAENLSFLSSGNNHNFVHGGYGKFGSSSVVGLPIAGVTLDVFSGYLRARSGIQIRGGTTLEFFEATNTFKSTFAASASQAVNAAYTLPVAVPVNDRMALTSLTTGVMSWLDALDGVGSYDPGSLTVPDAHYHDHTRQLVLTGSEQLALVGTARFTLEN